jgi:iron complex outermembrane receptor protein
LQGNPLQKAENMIAYEIGYRAQPRKEYSYDVALFYNVYESLVSLRPTDESEWYEDPVYHQLIAPIYFGNAARGQSYGVELSGQWSPSERWRLSSSYCFLKMHLTSQPGTESYLAAGDSPRNQVRLMSSWDLGNRWQFDAIWRYVDCLSNLGVPSYLTMDARLAWQPRKNMELALIGRNLFDSHHQEFAESIPIFFYGTQVRRSVFANFTWRY